MPNGSTTSLIDDHISVSGLTLACGTATSPENFTYIANVEDLNIPQSATEVMVTNVADTWVRRVPTLLDMGKVAFKIFWVMDEPSHGNQAGSSTVAPGLRYMFVNKVLRDFQVAYPESGTPVDAFSGYVTSFQITAKVGGVFESAISIGTTGTPSLV